jgi:hypothetical protein
MSPTLIIIIVSSCLGLCCTICLLYYCYKCYNKSRHNTPTILPIYQNNPGVNQTNNIPTPDYTFNPQVNNIPNTSIVRRLNYNTPVKEDRGVTYIDRSFERSSNMYRTPNIVVDHPEDYYVESVPHKRYIIDRNYTEIPRARTMRSIYPSYTEY